MQRILDDGDESVSLVDSRGDRKFPMFLYDLSLMDGSMTKGLFRGPLLLKASRPPLRYQTFLTVLAKVYTHIFISRSGARGQKLSAKSGNAKIHGMRSATPASICYAAIQVCFNLPSFVTMSHEILITDLFRAEFRG